MESDYGRHRSDSGSTPAPRYYLNDAGGRHSRKNDQTEAQEYATERIPRHIRDDNRGSGTYVDQQAYAEELDSRTRQSRRHQERPLRALQATRQRRPVDHQTESTGQDELVAQDNRHDGQSSAHHYELSSSQRSRPIAVPHRSRDEVAEDELEIPERQSQRRHDSYAESPRCMGRSPQSLAALPRHRSDYDHQMLDRHGRIQRRDSDGQQDGRRTISREQDQANRYSESPRHVNQTNGGINQIVQDTAALSMSPRNADVVAASPASRAPRRGSSNSLLELAHNKYDFEAIIVTEPVNRYDEYVRRSVPLQAVVDTGCEDDVVLESVLARAGINARDIEDIGREITFEGFEGMKYKIRKRVRLTWGKRKHDGRRTRRDYFYIVKELPGKVEMVLGREYMTKEIERHTRWQNSSRAPSFGEDEDFEDWVVLEGPDKRR